MKIDPEGKDLSAADYLRKVMSGLGDKPDAEKEEGQNKCEGCPGCDNHEDLAVAEILDNLTESLDAGNDETAQLVSIILVLAKASGYKETARNALELWLDL